MELDRQSTGGALYHLGNRAGRAVRRAGREPDRPWQQLGSAQGVSLGTGFVWDAVGHIVTNNHVVEQAQTRRNELRARIEKLMQNQ